MNNDEVRAFAAMRRTEVRGTNEEPFGFGTAVMTPELPLRHDSNFLYADRLTADATAAELAAEADRILGEAGYAHRVITCPGDDAARLADDFRALEWNVDRHLLMVLRRPPEREADTARVTQVDADTLRPFRMAFIRTYPWGTAAVAEQLAAWKTRIAGDVRFYAVLDDGEPVAATDLYLSDGDAQVEDVATHEAHRGRGHATALVQRAVDDAHAAGAEFVFLVADSEDWPQHLYRSLGFDDAGGYWKFFRV